MPFTFVLMTAMPPTKGHRSLIEFAYSLGHHTVVILATQPGEPFVDERAVAIQNLLPRNGTTLRHIHQTLPQEPTEGDEVKFWDMWAGFLKRFGAQKGDYIVASENYGAKLAEIIGGTFIPYDMDRQIFHTKATRVREYPLAYFHDVLPEFQRYLRKRVTIFGAESTGKSTLTKLLASYGWGRPLPEWARGYLELPSVGPEVTEEKMQVIWDGQRALQVAAKEGKIQENYPAILQGTDLFSTIGYWRLDKTLGDPPKGLISDAIHSKSDLYIVTPSNIPFEPDPLRYGGDKRESSDQYWIDILEEFGLNYVVLESDELQARARESYRAMEDVFNKDAAGLNYKREGKEYE